MSNQTILDNMVIAVNIIQDCPEFTLLIPEVRVNMVYAPALARTSQDVAAVDGRITVVRGLPRASGLPAFGASDHMARLIIEARKYEPEVNAGINFKCDNGIINMVKSYCAEKGLKFGWIDRSREPKEVIERDGKSMPWKIGELVRSSGGLPKIFYEGEGLGKEPLFVALGSDAVDVATIATSIARVYAKTQVSGKKF